MNPPPDSCAGALAEAYGLGRVEAFDRVARGAMGAVWRLRTESGWFAAKESFWFAWDEEAVRSEVAFNRACADVGVPSPRPLAATSGAYAVDVDGVSWRLYEWVDGEVPTHADVDVSVWVASRMGAMHSLEWLRGEGERGPFYQRVDGDWSELAELASREGAVWAGELRRQLVRLTELTELVNAAPEGDVIWCHRDLKNTNVLHSPDHAVLVDWDNAGPMAPWRELGAVLFGHLTNEDALRRVVEAYRASGGSAELTGADGFATGLAIHLNFLHGQAGAALDHDLAAHHREYADDKVAGLLTGLPTPAELEYAAEVVQG
ncbi:phosphotransferase enzyme family protein [Kribbella amoyensis]|uniref:phosphotransferase enzyme family protein n=1 Tax=Kribbella amoyensis TaxID=996641 RepID=UPI0011A8BF8A|nr:phosphotransferase [Kribbella amoyensis]